MNNGKYEINEVIFDNFNTGIARATRVSDDVGVIIKSHKGGDSHRVKYEYNILKNKRIAGAANVLDLFFDEGKAYLVLEDNGAVVLDKYLEDNKVDQRTFLTIAINAAKALGSIHERGIIHRDIKPSNMLISPETLDILYIDFGIASDDEQIYTNENLHGTLDYIPPEQTGRVKLEIDERSDIYSLGAAFYKILCSHPPFECDTVGQLIHAHIAVTPEPLDKLMKISPVVSKIISKMLDKSPKGRYQSAAGLYNDLMLCAEAMDRGEEIPEFQLGSSESFVDISHRRKLYGKEQEMFQLKQVFDRVSSSVGELVILRGGRSSGKTLLVRKFGEHVTDCNGLLLEGSFEDGENGETYSALRFCFAKYFDHYMNSEESLTALKNALKERVGSNGQALVNLFPFLEDIIGIQPGLAPLGFMESQQRTVNVFIEFLTVVATPSQPLCVFLDNVQWADYYSLQLVLAALADKSVCNIMFIWDICDDAKENLQLNEIMEMVKDASFNVTQIKVPYLSAYEVRQVVADLLEQPQSKIEDLAAYVYAETSGKPFLVMELLRQLNHEGLIVRDNSANSDGDFTYSIEEIKRYSPHLDIERAYTGLIDNFDSGLQGFAKFLALCGYEFDFDYIRICAGRRYKDAAIKEFLSRLVKERIIEYDDTRQEFRFLNAEVHRACMSTVSESEAMRLHDMIGSNILEKSYNSIKLLEYNSETIVSHLNAAGQESRTPEQLPIIAELNYFAGNRAFAAANSTQALRFYAKGIEALGDGFDVNFELAMKLYSGMAECYFSMGDFENADQAFDMMIANTAVTGDVFAIYRRRVMLYLTINDYPNAIKHCLICLSGRGILLEELAIDPEEFMIAEEKLFLENLESGRINQLLESGEARDKEHYEVGGIMAILAVACFHYVDNGSAYYVYKTVNYSLEHGRFPMLENALSLAGACRSLKRDRKTAREAAEFAIRYAEALDTPKASCYYYYAYMVSPWINSLEENLQAYREAKNVSFGEGNLYFSSACEGIILTQYRFTDVNCAKYLKEVEQAYEYARKVGNELGMAIYTVHRQHIRCLMGRTLAPDTFSDRVFSEEEFLEEYSSLPSIEAHFYAFKMITLCMNGYYQEAVDAEKDVELYVEHLGASLILVICNFMYSVAMLKLCAADASRLEEFMPQVERNQRLLKNDADLNPSAFSLIYSYIDAEIKRLKGDAGPMMQLGVKCFETDCIKGYFGACINESMIDHWHREGLTPYKYLHMTYCYSIYKKIGMAWRAREIEEETGYNGEKLLTAVKTVSSSTITEGGISRADADMVLDIISLLSDDLRMGVLCERYLDILINNSGADKGFVVIKREDSFYLEAVHYADINPDNISKPMLPLRFGNIEEHQVPVTIIRSVMAKRSLVTIESSDENYMHFKDAYIRRVNPESFVCMPIISKDKVMGAVYLENERLPAVFDDKRLALMSTVNMQSAVIIQNAIYYNEISNYTKTVEARLSEQVTQQNSLIAGIAHEANSPIGVCVTVISRMRELTADVNAALQDKKLSKTALNEYLEEAAKGMEIAYANITRAAELIQNFKKVSVDQSNEVFEELNMYDTLVSIAEYIRPAIKKKVGNMDIEGPKDFLMESCAGVLTQIFTNLMMNSAIHAFEGMEKDKCNINIKLIPGESETKLIYSDNGKGMTEKELEKLFQPFYTTKRNRGGSGLGMHIILTLVTQTLGGSIDCVSTPGLGTSFIILLPKVRKAGFIHAEGRNA